jgi:hypothetical protein
LLSIVILTLLIGSRNVTGLGFFFNAAIHSSPVW